jgi:hypothetical protein
VTLSAQSDRMTFARILATWASQTSQDQVPRGRLAIRLDRFQFCHPSFLTSYLGGAGPSVWDLVEIPLWFRGPDITTGTPTLAPIVTVRVSLNAAGGLEACIRIALFFESDGNVDWVGWRFETADPPGGPHVYPHAQHIAEWRKSIAIDDDGDLGSIIDGRRSVGRHMNQRRPAFPLRGGGTISGLAVVTIATLYGAPVTQNWLQLLSREAGVAEEVRKDIATILG